MSAAAWMSGAPDRQQVPDKFASLTLAGAPPTTPLLAVRGTARESVPR